MDERQWSSKEVQADVDRPMANAAPLALIERPSPSLLETAVADYGTRDRVLLCDWAPPKLLKRFRR